MYSVTNLNSPLKVFKILIFVDERPKISGFYPFWWSENCNFKDCWKDFYCLWFTRGPDQIWVTIFKFFSLIQGVPIEKLQTWTTVVLKRCTFGHVCLCQKCNFSEQQPFNFVIFQMEHPVGAVCFHFWATVFYQK